MLPLILPVQLFVPFLTSPRAPIITGTVAVFIPPLSRFLSQDRCTSRVFHCFQGGVPFCGDTHIDEQFLSFLSFTTTSGLFAFISLSVRIGMSQSVIVAVWFSFTVAGSCS